MAVCAAYGNRGPCKNKPSIVTEDGKNLCHIHDHFTLNDIELSKKRYEREKDVEKYKSLLETLYESKEGELISLSGNHISDYIWRFHSMPDDIYIPLKIKTDIDNKGGTCIVSKYDGVLALTYFDNTMILLSSNDIIFQSKKQISMTKIRDEYSNKIISNEYEIISCLRDLIPLGKSIDVINDNVYIKVLSREENVKNNGKNNEQEFNAHLQFRNILGDSYIKTCEGCIVDWVYYKHDKKMVIPVQTKTTRISSSNKYTFNVSKYNNYTDMLVACRPVSNNIGTFVVPGSIITKSGFICYESDGTNSQYLIRDDYFAEFFSNLYDAILSNKTTFTWPSDYVADISNIKLKNFDSISIPKSPTAQIEYMNYKWRSERFPWLNYVLPDVEQTTVDVIINGHRIQDKSGRIRKKGSLVSIHKNAGYKNGKASYQPYEINDFDFLWVFPAEKRRYMFIIPMSKLVEKGCIKTDTTPGVKDFTCYDLEVVRAKKGPVADLWTQEYCIDTEKSDVNEQILKILG